MHTVTKIQKNTDVWVSDKNDDPVPGIEFSFEIKTLLSTEEIYIYYNTIDNVWFGEQIHCGEWTDIPEDELKDYIDAYDLKARLYNDR